MKRSLAILILTFIAPAVAAAQRIGVAPGNCSGTDKVSGVSNEGSLTCTTDASSAGGGYATVQDEATPLTQRDTINFTGAGVTCADNGGTSSTDCTIAGAGGGDVLGPANNTDSFVPQWNGAGSKTLKDGLAVASANTASALVARDGSGNFAAGTITAALVGNASTATALAADPAACSENQFANDTTAAGAVVCAQPAFTNLSGAAVTAQLPANQIIHSFGATFTGSDVAAGKVVYLTVPFACTITAWDIQATGTSPTITFDIWKIATGGTALPTVTNTIMGTKPALATGNAIHSTTLTAWTTSIAANDRIAINIDAVTVTTWVEITVSCNAT